MSNEKSPLVGRKIVDVRKINQAELDKEGWEDTHGTAYVLVMDNGDRVYASRDDEGNGPGTMFGMDKKGDGFYIMK